jgi:hypothetical protein
MAYEVDDTTAELHYYEKLGIAYMNVGDPKRMKAYNKRVVDGIIDPPNGINRTLSKLFLKDKR